MISSSIKDFLKMPRRQGLTFFLPGEKSKQKTPRCHHDNIMDLLFSSIVSARAVARSHCSTYNSCWWNNGDFKK